MVAHFSPLALILIAILAVVELAMTGSPVATFVLSLVAVGAFACLDLVGQAVAHYLNGRG